MPLGEIREITEGGETFNIYICSACEYQHDYHWDAVGCCMFECEWCGAMYATEEELDNCCQFDCGYCGSRYNSEDVANDCCYEQREEDNYRREYFNPDYPSEIRDVEPRHILYIPRLDDERPVRICSIEQELSSGGAAIARMLYDLGVSEHDTIINYSGDARPGRVVVKGDSSLAQGGGEVVYSRFDLNDRAGFDRLSKTLACIEALQQEGIVSAGMDAGTHIHISGTDENGVPIGPAEIAGIYEIFSFAEDVIFRMGAAGTPQHRGLNYTRLMPKFARDDADRRATPGKIAKASMGQRYFSLNFQRLLNAAQSCRCGAIVVGDWESCDCNVLRNGTVEWRVFNSTTDPEILHSWLLLAHGITAASFDHQLHTLLPNEYNQTWPELHPWIFGWLLWNCPFQDEERQILFNTARRSPGLMLPWENIDQFHEGWGQLEIPVPPEPDEFFEPGVDGAFPGCLCNNCAEARAAFQETRTEQAEQPPMRSTFVTTSYEFPPSWYTENTPSTVSFADSWQLVQQNMERRFVSDFDDSEPDVDPDF